MIHVLGPNAPLPQPWDKYVLVYGVDKRVYGKKEWHVAYIDDDDGNGFYRWMTEAGRVISDVTHWAELPEKP